MRLRALLFDVDGTIADTERHGHRPAYNRAFRELGLPWRWGPKLYRRLLRQPGGRERLKHYLERYRPALGACDAAQSPDRQDLVHRVHEAKSRHFRRLVQRGKVPLRPGVARLMREAHDAGVAIGIVSNASRATLEPLLEHALGTELAAMLAAVVGGEDAPRKKPAPDAYRRALELLGVAPGSAVAIEDSRMGLRAAAAAGVATVITVNDDTRDQDFRGARLVVDCLGDPGTPATVLQGAPLAGSFVQLADLERLLSGGRKADTLGGLPPHRAWRDSMRRWNGWGEQGIDYPLTPDARAFLAEQLGPAEAPQDASLEQALAAVPESRLAIAGAQTDPMTRLLHARGQSFPDWVAMRSGRMGPFPDAVAMPERHEDVAALLEGARRAGAVIVPWGGGTSVVGHLTPQGIDRPVLSLSLERMNRLLSLNEHDHLARLGAGAAGPEVESQLRAQGYTLGHFPQSFEYSTLGGWVVTRSSGQQSLRYGRIEQLFAAGRLATFRGDFAVGGVAASSAGPDLRELVLASEGRLGVLTEAVVRVRPVPEREEFHGVFFPDWQSALAAIRTLARADLGLSMLRLSNAVETETQLRLAAGHARAIAWLERYLRLRGIGPGKCMLTVGISGSPRAVRRMRADMRGVCRAHRGVATGTLVGRGWAKNRFRGPYLRNSLWEAGYGVDTVETCVDWSRATAAMQAMEQAARDAFAAFGERVHAFTHLSHVYRQGCSVYSTFVFRLARDPDENLARWRRFKQAVSEVIVANRGTISHQHGVGRDHAPYLAAEKGEIGMDLIRAAIREMDPDGLMNPGCLLA